jgi:1-acyl-sn-glycerol-3-phosphate acyltransferase
VSRQELRILDFRLPLPAKGAEPIQAIVSAWTWLLVGATVFAGVGVQGVLAVIDHDDPTRRRPGRILRDMGVFVAKLNPLWDFRVHGELPDYVPGKTVIVANHVSNSDPFLIAHLPWEMKWLGKAELFKVPVFGWALRLAGDVPVARGTGDSIRQAMDHCKAHLARGMPVMIFPEGTRSKSAELLPFKNGAFRLAIEAGADVLPIAVAGTRDALPKHSWRFGFARGRVAVGTPISTAGMTLDDLPRLKEEARAQIERLVQEIGNLPEDNGRRRHE